MLVCSHDEPIIRIENAGAEAAQKAKLYTSMGDCRVMPAGTEYLVEQIARYWARIRQKGEVVSSYAQVDQLAGNAAIIQAR